MLAGTPTTASNKSGGLCPCTDLQRAIFTLSGDLHKVSKAVHVGGDANNSIKKYKYPFQNQNI